MLAIREATETDYPLIADSYWRTARSVPACYGAGRAFLVSMLDRVIADPSWNVVVLYETDVPDETIGWAAYRATDELFWLAIKPRFQRLGMARELLRLIGSGRELYVPFADPRLVSVARIRGYDLRLRPYMPLVKVIDVTCNGQTG